MMKERNVWPDREMYTTVLETRADDPRGADLRASTIACMSCGHAKGC